MVTTYYELVGDNECLAVRANLEAMAGSPSETGGEGPYTVDGQKIYTELISTPLPLHSIYVLANL